jgi:hypothetical protein
MNELNVKQIKKTDNITNKDWSRHRILVPKKNAIYRIKTLNKNVRLFLMKPK